MERLKKFCYTYKTLIFISVLVFVLILCFLIMRKPAKLYNFLYLGNNIRLDLNLNINGELINTRDMCITCMDSDGKKKVKIKEIVSLKLDCDASYSGLPDDHF